MAHRKSTRGLNIIIDDTPISADFLNRTIRLPQASLIQTFNYKERIFASMPDIYNAAKANNPGLISDMKSDMHESAIITSTRIDYNKKSLDAKITHYHDSQIVAPVERKVFVPMYFAEELSNVLLSQHGVDCIQAMFNTKDSPEEINRTLLRLSYTDSAWVITSNRLFAEKDTKRAAALTHRYGRLVINATLDIKSEYGNSRGAMISP